MGEEINVSVVESEKVILSLVEPQPINITLGQVFDADLATKIAQVLSIFEPPEGKLRVVKLYVSQLPHHKLEVEYETE